MSGHVMQWEFDDGIVKGAVYCREEVGAACRLVPKSYHDCQCESWTIERDERGPFHMIEGQRHDMEPADYCNVENFLNEGDLMEQCNGQFVIAETAIEPVWMGDCYDWEPAK